jgi:isopenicillin N synthase-like dioxygenase
MSAFYKTCFAASLDLLRALTLALLPDDPRRLDACHTTNGQLRLLRYPAAPRADFAAGRLQRMPAHSDFSTITLLFQDGAGGLQIERGGGFVDVAPLPGALVLNVGDPLMRWSNGRVRSTLHRVVQPPPGRGDRDGLCAERYSIPFFLGADWDAFIGVWPECVPEGEQPRFRDVSFEEYAKLRFANMYPEDRDEAAA